MSKVNLWSLKSAGGCVSGAVVLWLSLAGQAVAAPPESGHDIWQPQLHWRLVGPFRGGRTRAAAGVPGQPNVFYMGQVDGGVWKTTDSGRTWDPVFDAQSSQSIGAIAVAPSDPNLLYVASGEGLHRPDLSVGNGIYRSRDAGKTWEHLPGLRDGQQIPALAIDPHDPKRLYAAVLGHPYGPNEERGIFRSADGGETWEKVLYKDANTGGSDVRIDPAHPDTVYASLWESRLGPWEDGNQYDGIHGGLFKSTDGGKTWRQLTKGLPENVQQINVTLCAGDSKRLYATLSTPREGGGYASGAGLGFYRSDDAGETWTKATDDPRPAMKIGGGDLPVPAVDPRNPDVVYSASIVTMKSTDGGRTWTSFRGAPGGDDYQNLWINPDNPNIILLVADQGALVTENGGQSWSSWYNQPTAQLYHVATTSDFPYRICAGQQESGSVCIASRGNDGEITFREWHPAGIIEYGYAAPDPLHPDIIYGAGRTEVSKFDSKTGQVQNITPIPMRNRAYRADRTEPLLFSPLDPHQLFYATNVLWKTSDYGKNWDKISPDLTREHTGQPASLQALPQEEQDRRRGTIYSVAASFKDLNTLWAGTDDGFVWLTRDSGKNWKNITPEKMTPWSKVTQIAASHFDDSTAYVSVSRFRVDDLHPYLYRTHDGGATWQPITAGLPDDAPVNVVREDPVRKGLLFAGTETTVWWSTDDGDHWQPLQYNLPHTSMRDLEVHGDDLIVATHGRSFWVLDGINALRQTDRFASTHSEAVLFKPGDAVRVRRSTYTDTPVPPDEPMGENPPDGAVIDYALPDVVQGVVTLEVLDKAGVVVRRFASNDAPYATQEQLARQLIPLYWLRMPATLPATPGMHRWIWDLHWTTPTATRYEYPISAVPHDTPRTPLGTLALPGEYSVRLTVNGKAQTVPLTIKMDPRVPATAADLNSLFQLESQLSAMLNKGAGADLEAHAAREQVQNLAKSAPADVKPALDAMDKSLQAVAEGKPSTPAAKGYPGIDEISGEAGTLFGEVGQVDAAPTTAQQKATAHVADELKEAMERWDRIKATEIPELNRKLNAAHLPPLNLQSQPETMPEGGDED